MADESDKRTDSHRKPQDESRRRFLKGVGIAGAGAAFADQLLAEAQAANTEAAKPARAVTGKVEIVLDINQQKKTLTVEPRTTLLNALRNHVEPAITGPKLVCDMGTCGACTVLLDGKTAYACLVLAIDAVGKKITTVEGLGTPASLNSVQQEFVEKDALMCGFCTPGFVTTISAYLKQNPNPSLDDVQQACKGNFCRCGTYPRVFAAALAAAKRGTVDV
jgi:xanthine dehydrogenase YagT iron-sulfur-binding subunit